MLLLFERQASLALFPRRWHADDCRFSRDHLMLIFLLLLVLCLASLRYDAPFMETMATFKYHELIEKFFFRLLYLFKLDLLLRLLIFILVLI